MTSFRLLKPGTISTFITLLMTLQISACSTEDFAQAVAGNIISDSSSSLTTSNFSQAGNLAPVPVPGTGTESALVPAPDPTAAVAMYSYNENLSNAQPLNGAALAQTTVYIFFSNTAQYSSIRFYCCKGISGENNNEGHNEPSRDSSAPFIYSVDLSQYGSTGTRELYVDATHANGSGYDSLNANFSINITTTPITPEPEYKPEPAPESTEPAATVYSDVNLSWLAPVQREDNKTISPAEIAGYKIYYGTTKGKYTKSVYVDSAGGSIDSYTLKNIPEGTYYFVMTTRDTGNRESRYSTEVTIIASSL